MSLFGKITKGIKKGVKKIGKGIKGATGKTVKGLKAAGFNKNFGRDFMKGFASVGKALQVPEKFITKNDPLRKSLGFLSPISLAGSILTAPLTSVGVLEELAGSKKMQKKLKSGDVDTITDVALTPLGLLPLGGGGAVKSVGKKVGKSIARGFGRGISKLF